MEDRSSIPRSPEPQQAVGDAIQKITAARLGRGFLPLALLAVTGIVQVGAGQVGGWSLIIGALATATAMLAFGLRNVQLAFGREQRTWMSAAMVGSFIPPVFTFYVFAWHGLREVATGDGTMMRLMGLLLTGLGLWALRSWMRVSEVHRLAQTMNLNVGLDGREAL